MNESEWMTSTDPLAMLRLYTSDEMPWKHGVVAPLVSDRRLRLFACACVRHLLPNITKYERNIIEVAEGQADGEKEDKDLYAAYRLERQWNTPPSNIKHSVIMHRATANHTWSGEFISQQTLEQALYMESGSGPVLADTMREIIGNPYRPVSLYVSGNGSMEVSTDPSGDGPWWTLTPTVISLAQAAYDLREVVKCEFCKGRGKFQTSGSYSECPKCAGVDGVGTGFITTGKLDPTRLAILADALEETGCMDEKLLRHLRRPTFCVWCKNTGKISMPVRMGGPYEGPKPMYVMQPPEFTTEIPCSCGGHYGPHYRGCWVLDLLLGKS